MSDSDDTEDPVDRLRCNRRASDLSAEYAAAHWNMGIAATALRDWPAARGLAARGPSHRSRRRADPGGLRTGGGLLSRLVRRANDERLLRFECVLAGSPVH
jgi:hypothetical protein